MIEFCGRPVCASGGHTLSTAPVQMNLLGPDPLVTKAANLDLAPAEPAPSGCFASFILCHLETLKGKLQSSSQFTGGAKWLREMK